MRLPLLQAEVKNAKVPLATAIGFAIAGNIIDYGAAGQFDVEEAFRRSREMSYAIDHRAEMLAALASLQPGANILYLTDNCGEIVYDSLVIEILAQKKLDITVAVKSGAIINDALLEDAYTAGLDKWATIIANGTSCPGTPLESCSEEFRQLFEQADMVISKGQGNFETLSGADRNIFFLLTVKCKVVAQHLEDITESSQELSGKGEMVVYYLQK